MALAARASTRDFRPPLLVLRALGLGDLLTAVPALRALRRAHGELRMTLACPAWLHALARSTGAVDDAIGVDGLDVFRTRLPPALAVNLHGRGPQSHRRLLAQRPLALIAFAHDDIPQTDGMPRWRAAEHEVSRWCRLLRESGIPSNPDDLDLDDAFLRGRAPRFAAGATVIHAGASSGARRWPAERFAAVARAETARGRRVVLTGGVDDVAQCATIARDAALPDTAIVAGATSVLELAAIVSVAARVVVGDTGVAHLATALRRPSVVLFGPVSPAEWGPPANRPWHRALWAGRTGDPHAHTTDRGLLEISVRDVVDALDALPDSEANASTRFAQRHAG